MALQDPLRGIRIAQVPEEDDGRGIVGGRGEELRRVIRVPRNGADSLAVVVEGKRRLLRLQIPHGHKASGSSSRENMRHLPVPRQGLDVIRACGGGAEPECTLGIVYVVDEDFTLSPRCRDDVRLQGVELQCLGGPGVLRRLGYEGVGSPCDELFRIPEGERAVLEGAGDDAPWVVFIRSSPGDVVEARNKTLVSYQPVHVHDGQRPYLESVLMLVTG